MNLADSRLQSNPEALSAYDVSETTGSTRDTLDVVAGKIRALLQKSEDQRISAARLLTEARERVDAGEAGEITWGAWCKINVERSPRDVRRLFALVKADDPAAKLEQDRTAARDGMARLRQRTNVSPAQAASEPLEAVATEEPVSIAIRAVQALSDQDLARFEVWYRSAYPEVCTQAAGLDEIKILGEPSAATSPVQSPGDSSGLLAALDALTGDDHKNAYDWVMCGDVLGHELPKGRAGEFCDQYLAACEEARRNFRSQLTARRCPT